MGQWIVINLVGICVFVFVFVYVQLLDMDNLKPENAAMEGWFRSKSRSYYF